MAYISRIKAVRKTAPIVTPSGQTVIPAGASTVGTFGSYHRSYVVDYPEKDDFKSTAPIRRFDRGVPLPNLL